MKVIRYVADLVDFGLGGTKLEEHPFDICAIDKSNLFNCDVEKPTISHFDRNPRRLSMEIVVDNLGDDDLNEEDAEVLYWNTWFDNITCSIDAGMINYKINELQMQKAKGSISNSKYKTYMDLYDEQEDLKTMVAGAYPYRPLTAYRLVAPSILRLYYASTDSAYDDIIEIDLNCPRGIIIFRELDCHKNPTGRYHRLDFCSYQAIEVESNLIRTYDLGYNQRPSVFKGRYAFTETYDPNQRFVLGPTLVTEITLD